MARKPHRRHARLLVAAVALGTSAAMLGMLRRRPHWERAYYVLLVIVIAANILWGGCPLTRWEQGLRNWDAPGTAYCDSFIGHYLPLLPRRVLAWLGPGLMAGAFLAAPLWRWADRHRRPPDRTSRRNEGERGR